jgi:hypothetical protein
LLGAADELSAAVRAARNVMFGQPAGGCMTRAERDRERLRAERDLREAERILAHLRGVTLDEAAQALKDHAVLVGTSMIEVARELLAHRPVIRPRVLRVPDLREARARSSRPKTQ